MERVFSQILSPRFHQLKSLNELPQLKCWIAVNGLLLLHLIVAQVIVISSHWSLMLFFLDFALFLIPLGLNVLFLFGSDGNRTSLADGNLTWITTLYTITVSLLTLSLVGYFCFALSGISFTDFTGLLQVIAFLLGIVFMTL